MKQADREGIKEMVAESGVVVAQCDCNRKAERCMPKCRSKRVKVLEVSK